MWFLFTKRKRGNWQRKSYYEACKCGSWLCVAIGLSAARSLLYHAISARSTFNWLHISSTECVLNYCANCCRVNFSLCLRRSMQQNTWREGGWDLNLVSCFTPSKRFSTGPSHFTIKWWNIHLYPCHLKYYIWDIILICSTPFTNWYYVYANGTNKPSNSVLNTNRIFCDGSECGGCSRLLRSGIFFLIQKFFFVCLCPIIMLFSNICSSFYEIILLWSSEYVH